MPMFVKVDDRAAVVIAAVVIYGAAAVMAPDATASVTADAVAFVEGLLP